MQASAPLKAIVEAHKRPRPDDPDDLLPPAYFELILRLRELHAEEQTVPCKRLHGLESSFSAVKARNLSQYLQAAERDGIIKFRDGHTKCRLRHIWRYLPRKERKVEADTSTNNTFDIDLDAVPAVFRPLIRYLRDQGAGGQRWVDRDAAEASVHVRRAAEKHGHSTTLRYLNKAEDDCMIEVDRSSASKRLIRLSPIWRRIHGDVLPVAFKMLILRMLELLGDRIDGWAGTKHLNENGEMLPSFHLTQRVDILGYLVSARFAGIIEWSGELNKDSPVRFTTPWRDFLKERDKRGRFYWHLMPIVEPFKALIDQICALNGSRGRAIGCSQIVKDPAIRNSFCLARVFKLRPYLQAAADAGVIVIDESEEEEAKLQLTPDYFADEETIAHPQAPPAGYAPLIQLLQVMTSGDAYVDQTELYCALGSARDSLADKAGLAVRPGFDRFTAFLIHGEQQGVLERSESKGIRLSPTFRITADSWLDSLKTEWSLARDGAL